MQTTTTRSAATGWFTPLFDVTTWKRAAYLLGTFPLGQLWFIFTVTAFSLGLGLSIIWVGIPILAGAFWLLRVGARFERLQAASLLGVEILSPYRPSLAQRPVERAKAHLRDPATWRDLLYLNLLFPLGMIWLVLQVTLWTICFVFTFAPLGLALGERFGWEITMLQTTRMEWTLATWPEAFLASAFGILFLLPVTARIVRGAGALQARIAHGLLSPTASSQLHARVEQLTISGKRGLDAAEAERSRIERDLHDGAQQRLVAVAMELGMAREKIADDPEQARVLVDTALENAKLAITELRDLARGIHPVVLTDRGLDAALSALAARSAIPVTVDTSLEGRLPATLESTAYFVVAEALTNAQKHSGATRVSVSVRQADNHVRVTVTDNGRGGADPAGAGLTGLANRVAAIHGTLTVTSPVNGPTIIEGVLPCAL